MLDQQAVDFWLADFLAKVREAFGERVRFVGHHGSWPRGEGTPESDIDAMVILDRVEPEDLAAYRAIVDSMPEGGRHASGLLNSVAEMCAHPRSERLQYFHGCKVLHGSVEGILEPPTAEDLLEDIKIKASDNLLATRHYLLYSHDLADRVHNLHYPFKEAFYALQSWTLLRTGEFVARKEDLLPLLADADDQAVVMVARDWRQLEADRTARPRHYIELLERWSRRMLERVAGAEGRTGS
jgi:hypothetical protein